MIRRAAPALAAMLALALAPAADGRAAARTWYVRAGAAPGGSGSRTSPLDSLAAVEAASRAGDRIVVLPSSAPLGGGIALKPRQQLVGAGPAVTRGGLAATPRIENTDRAHVHGDAVELAPGATVRNIVIDRSYRGGIYGRDVDRVAIAGNDLSHTNSSCTTGFVVQPFKLPTLVAGVSVPFSAGLPNGWAAIMVDAGGGRTRAAISANRIHDGDCNDGIDVRALGPARVSARIASNAVTHLREGTAQQSVLAIGLQALDGGRLDATVTGNSESYIGSAIAGDLGFADSEGLFANAAGRSGLTARIDRNNYAHGLGHLSANCLEVVSSNGGPRLKVTLSYSTCDHVVGDVIEAVNLSRDARLSLALDHVRAADSEFPVGPAFHQAEPGDDGDCVFELGSGAHTRTRVTIADSVLTGCVTDGLEVAGSVADGSGPVDLLSFDVRRSRITGNTLSNLRVAAASPVTRLDGRVEGSDLAGSPGTPVILERIDPAPATGARLDLGGGPLGSRGGNCIGGGGALDVLGARLGISARGDWWGRPGGPALGRTAVAGGVLDGGAPLGAPPAICR